MILNRVRPPDWVIHRQSLFLNLEENDEKGVIDDDHGIMMMEEEDGGGILGGESSSTGTGQDAPPPAGDAQATPPPVEEKKGADGEGAPTAAAVKKRGLTPFLRQMQVAIRRHKLLHRGRPATAGATASKDCATCQLTSINDPQILANQARSDRCLKFLDSHSQSAEAYCAKYWRAKYAKRSGPHRPENTASGGCCGFHDQRCDYPNDCLLIMEFTSV